MENNLMLIESLLDKETGYGKASFDLIKLKALKKTADAASTVIPFSFILSAILSFMLFINIALAYWLGRFFGETYFGFLLVGSFYGFSGLVLHIFLQKWIKKQIRNSIIKLVLK